MGQQIVKCHCDPDKNGFSHNVAHFCLRSHSLILDKFTSFLLSHCDVVVNYILMFVQVLILRLPLCLVKCNVWSLFLNF